MCIDFLTERFSARSSAQSAVIAPSTSCSLAELVDVIQRWTDRLKAEKIGAGTVVALESDVFSPNAVGLWFALAKRGAIIVPHGASGLAGRANRDELAQVEASFSIDQEDAVSFERAARTAEHDLYAELRRRRHPGMVLFSSGTTGEPKAAVHDLAFLLGKYRVRRPALTTLAFLLFDHIGGINTMLHTLSNGSTLVSVEDRSPDTVCRLIEKHRVELLPASPTFLNLLLLSEAHRRYDLSSLRVISYGTEVMASATLMRLRKAFPTVKLQQTYGMMELGIMRTKSRDDGSLWVKVGGEGYQVRVVDGVLQVRAQSQLLGYLNAIAPLTSDGWFVTGDIVERDGEFLRFLGRDTDAINVGGEKVFPAEIEGVIEAMDDVVEATVHGERNSLIGEIVCARVAVSKDDGDMPRRIKRFCRERLERFKVPSKVQIVTDVSPGERVKKLRRAS